MLSVSITSADVTLVLDSNGVIRDATLANAIAAETVEAWLGRPWPETVGGAVGERVRRMVEDARSTGISAFHHILQRFPSGLELPIEYTTVRTSGKKPGLLAMGKNLQAVAELQARLAVAQQATEREYWKLREVESRYRLLFDASNEAVLMIGAEDCRILEANPAAVRALGMAPGWDFLAELLPQEREGFRASLVRAREEGRAPSIIVHIGPARAAWVVRPSVMAAESGLRYLLQVVPVSGGVVALSPSVPVSVDHLIGRLPDAFVTVDRAGTILRANRAFLDLVQIGAEGAATGENLGRWLSRADVMALVAEVQRHRSVRLLATTIQGELGTATPVEVSAVANADANPQFFGVLLRDVARRLPGLTSEGPGAASSPALADTLGKVPLLEVVRNASDAVERQYIAAALERANGNRTAAADLLGLSRQSLHAKLNRYGFESAQQTRPDPTD